MKKPILLIALFSLFMSWAQQVEIAGKVTGEDNNPISGAVIKIVENQQQTTSDRDGKFIIKVQPRLYTLQVSAEGYATYNTRIMAQRYTYLNIRLQAKAERLKEVLITAVKATNNMPVAHTNIHKSVLQEQNLGQDVPYLIEMTPSVVVTSDAGAGVGYTGVRIRGISSQQINVTLNGIPLNDPESHSVYWVDIPDFAASTENLQIQRGVGTSGFGTGAFGAALHLETDRMATKSYAQVNTSYGSFNTNKYSIKGSTGLINKHFEFTGRFSKIKSDGYRDRAFSNLKSYYVSGSYKDAKNTLKAVAFGGSEVTYQAWDGVDKNTFDTHPTLNPAGAIYNDAWEIVDYYDNQVDDYKQDHYQLHFNHKINNKLKFNLTGHYTYGRGYYEQYKQDEDFSDYGFTPLTINGFTIDKTNLIRRKWLDNDFYGLVASAFLKTENMNITLGLAANEYDGRHFGRVIWAQFSPENDIRHEYYNNTGIKKTISGFAKSIYNLNNKLKLYTDIQFRRINYDVNGTVAWQTPWQVSDNLFFVNPKLGLYYQMSDKQSFYLSVAQTHREPNRDDYKNAPVDKPTPETLNDLEMGWKYRKGSLIIEANAYAMLYKDQLVLTGNLDNVGNPVRKNVGKSYRAGLETQFAYYFSKAIDIQANLTLSNNRNVDYYVVENNHLKNYGNTLLTYSPQVIAGGSINYRAFKGFQLKLISKYVGEQYMDNRNIEDSKLPAYFVENVLFSYQIPENKYFKNLSLTLKISNLFNKKYASNGYMWGDTPYYYPQAGRNVLVGLNLKF